MSNQLSEGTDADLSPGAVKRLVGSLLESGGPGSPGPPGEDGLSAYELAVLEGFQGSLSAWLASLEGPQGATGAQGPTGPQGPTGNTGSQGPQGDPGTNGAAGADGKTWHSGSGAPSSGLGVNGDFYLDTTADAYYGPKSAGAWGSATSLIGPQGPQGQQGIQGIQGVPGQDGADGNTLSAWPIGSVFLSVVSTSPATLLGGGTWSQIAGGRMLVGQTAGDADFDTAEETGGAKTHTLTTAEIPSHTHVLRSQTATTGSATSYEHGTLDTSSAEAEATEVTDPAGGGGAHNNMPPYLVVYIWKRTA